MNTTTESVDQVPEAPTGVTPPVTAQNKQGHSHKKRHEVHDERATNLNAGRLLFNRIYEEHCTKINASPVESQSTVAASTNDKVNALQNVLYGRDMSIQGLLDVYDFMSKDSTLESLREYYNIAKAAEDVNECLTLRSKAAQGLALECAHNLWYANVDNVQVKYPQWEAYSKKKFPSKSADTVIRRRTIYALVCDIPSLLFTSVKSSVIENSKNASQLQLFLHTNPEYQIALAQRVARVNNVSSIT